MEPRRRSAGPARLDLRGPAGGAGRHGADRRGRYLPSRALAVLATCAAGLGLAFAAPVAGASTSPTAARTAPQARTELRADADWEQTYRQLFYWVEGDPERHALLGDTLDAFEGTPRASTSEAARGALSTAVVRALQMPPAERPRRRSDARLIELFASNRALLRELRLGSPEEAFDWLAGDLLLVAPDAAERVAALGIARHPDTLLETRLRRTLAHIHYERWHLDQASKQLAQAFDAPLNFEAECDLTYLTGLVELRSGRSDLAIEALDGLGELAERSPDDPYLASLQRNLKFRILMSAERYREIVEQSPRTTPRDKLRVAIAMGELARLGEGSLEPAIELYREVLAAAREDPGLDRTLGQQARLRLGELQMQRGRLDEARALLDAWTSAPTPTDLDEELRGAAARARLELLAGAEPKTLELRRERLRAVFDRALAARRGLLLRSGGTGYLHFMNVRRAASDLVELNRVLTGARRAFEVLLELRDLGSLNRMLRPGGAPTSLADVRAVLPAGAGALSYLPGPDRTHLFLLDGSELHCEVLAPTRVWEPDRAALETHLLVPREGDGARAELEEHLGRLAAELLPPPVEARVLAWSEVLVEGLDLVGYLPLEPLPLSGGGRVDEALPVSYPPSLAVAVGLAGRERTSPARCDLALVAAPLEELEQPRIPWSWRHTWSFMRATRWGGLRSAVGRAADSAGLERAFAETPAWLLLVLHGTYDATRERPAGFLLGSELVDGELRAVRVFAEDLDGLEAPPVVFLGICGAARAQARSGDDGVNDLAGALLRGGARAVVMSPIDLDFEATAALAAVFGRELARGASVARALQAARLRLAAMPGYEHPYYHSTLHVVGLGDRPVFEEPLAVGLPLWMPATIAALLVAMVALLVRRARRAP